MGMWHGSSWVRTHDFFDAGSNGSLHHDEACAYKAWETAPEVPFTTLLLAAHLLGDAAALLELLDAIFHIHRASPRIWRVSSTVAGVRPAARAIATAWATNSPLDVTICPDGK